MYKQTMLKKLESVFQKAIIDDYALVGVEIQIAGNPDTEIIINKSRSFKSKLDYYLDKYAEDGCMKVNAAIRIIDVDYADYIDEMKWFKS